jgi:hypothetical protein
MPRPDRWRRLGPGSLKRPEVRRDRVWVTVGVLVWVSCPALGTVVAGCALSLAACAGLRHACMHLLAGVSG